MPNEHRKPPIALQYIFAIIDRVNDQIIGPLITFRHTAAAVRFFGDIATGQGPSIIAKHPADFDLYQLGYINEENRIVQEHELVLTGLAWQASQAQAQPSPSLAPGETQ